MKHQRCLRPYALLLAVATLLTLIAPAASAAISGREWFEDGDAGSHEPGQVVAHGRGGLRLDAINGDLHPGNQDVYGICITHPAQFSATTVGGASFDTQLFLFDQLARGVLANDDAGGTLQSTLPVGSLTGATGSYLLAITSYDDDPVDGNDDVMFPSFPFEGVHGPSTFPNALDRWTGSGFGGGAYRIVLTGAAFCRATA